MILIGLGTFIIIDSSLSIILGDRYMWWGLGYTPAFYQRLMERIYSLPQASLLGIKLFEMTAGMLLLFFGLS
ncbi:MAG: hypothetical protein KKI06_07085 [Euryarchaeota archaeon]|nr:hypothetical protein [Euryarchaeota archaeon]MBU4220680.1 hypothetical protein [Euryarchaeota archaeon]MCG2735016.1 hypothetical protein [Candidatus Methanoperedenaceae archaeon]